jgi:HSP20 family molecular chaperone IbpA
MKESGLAVQPARDTSVQKGASTDLVERMNNVYDRIARRAYEIFDGNGRITGRDLADWFQAEVEFLHPLHIGISESPEALTIRGEVPGFRPNDLEINVEPRRVTITGTRETKKESKTKETVYSETCSDQILRVLELPAAVDPAKVKATLKNGVLELDMPKANPADAAKADSKAVRLAPKAA